MSRRLVHLAALILFMGGLAWSFIEARSGGAAPSSNAEITKQDQQSNSPSEGEIQDQFLALEKDKATHAAELSLQAVQLQKRGRAAAKTEEYRKRFQHSRRDLWSEVISTNWQEFQKLRVLAGKSADGTTRCTICNGFGKMDFCVLCESSGLCMGCRGTGKIADEICPNCLGNGKCYLCSGTKRMTCLFCDDGTISTNGPMPSAALPLH
jgi:hypothetical protein